MRSISVLSFVITIFIILPHHLTQAHQTIEASALLKWKQTLHRESQSVLKSWARNNPCQGWIGITCSNKTSTFSKSVVTNITLNRLDLKGSLRYLNFSSFHHLQVLDLFNNSISGPVPSNVANISQLRYLNLGWNILSGAIPSEIGMLSSLEVLCLDSNSLTGHIPNSIGYLTNLVTLYLLRNKLTGTIPASFMNLTRLERLSLYMNHLHGPFPKDINLSKIRLFDVTNNMLSGPLPRVGVLVKYFIACNNLFSGGLPPEIGSKSSLIWLDLSRNHLSGPVPNIHNLTSLLYLGLDHNMFNGTLPPVPTITIAYSVKNNSMTGEIPSSFCNSTQLELFHVSDNYISGMVPECFSYGSNMTSLNLNTNRLHGLVPRSLTDCRLLQILDLGNNFIYDTIPHWLDALPKLQVLVLKSNQFHGVIETSSSQLLFPKLRILDLSKNQFTGQLPSKYIENFKAIMDIDPRDQRATYVSSTANPRYNDSVKLVVKGKELTYERILTLMTAIDLSNNNFEGEIPNNIRLLNSLLFLNLSHNNLTGMIPTMLGKLTKLESLDLSSNKLQGKIPTQLTRLTFLEVFNVSDNQLSGAIPEGGQFRTFGNDSYLGNIELYGFPLTNNCGDDGLASPSLPPRQEYDGSWFFDGFTWESVVLGYGCGIVLGIGLGYRMFLTGKTKWVWRIINTYKRRNQVA